MRETVLLGATVDKEIVFGEFEITHRNGYAEFTASFNTVRPFRESDVDLEDYFEDYADPRMMGAEWVIDRCNEFNCAPKYLPRELANACDDVRDALDCSLFPECYEIRDEYGCRENWFFESGSCGQHDTRNEMAVYVDKSAYDTLHSLWDLYHLSEVNEEKCKEKLEEVISALNVDWEEWITEYIKKEVM